MAGESAHTTQSTIHVSGDGQGETDTYAFQPASATREETTRLDDLNAAFKQLFGGNLSFAPLEELQPTAILEIGSGSGAWTIQAAEAFPQARVVAVDQNPIPPRALPPNVEYHKLDITQTFPFEDETFDIVHARLVLMHVPGADDVLRRAVQLLKPGGWIIVEDPDDGNMVDGGEPLGPGMGAFVGGWLKLLRSRGAEPCFGRYLGSELRSSDSLAEVHVRKITIPISGKSDDEEENKLGLAWKVNMLRVARDLPTRFAEQGITAEVAMQHLEELEDPARSITTDMYLSWSRKRL
ncbi:S-adenosyl-L-methionine-dependent methyltransferase [Ganoderma leucocontextum]|nr:S-adenosyl-L-methionine-dependent methyltransferase [Ganoderma leucocontextum]